MPTEHHFLGEFKDSVERSTFRKAIFINQRIVQTMNQVYFNYKGNKNLLGDTLFCCSRQMKFEKHC